MIKAVIFDVDGTLVNSVDYHAEAWQRAIAKFGKEVSFEKVRFQIGKGGDELMPVFFSEEELERIADDLTEYRTDLYHKEYMPRVQKLAGTRELIERLLQDGKQVALASSAKGEELGTYKEIAQIDDLVKTETSSDDAEKSKPNPDIFQAAIERLKGVTPEECLVVGDTPYDIEAAQKAGVRTIAVRSGGFPEDSLQEAVAIYDDCADLLAHYEHSPIVG